MSARAHAPACLRLRQHLQLRLTMPSRVCIALAHMSARTRAHTVTHRCVTVRASLRASARVAC
eukprot:6035294-Alexandrium_andersonii.AAC.1